MTINKFFGMLLGLAVFSSIGKADKPNIVFIMCDDLGYGDVHCMNPENGKIPTPSVDRLAEQGVIFTDAHSGSAVCTPTRYGVLTGRYSWRTRLQRGVVQGFAPCLIAPDRPTVAGFLKSKGYHAAIIGKWHLDCQYQDPKTGKTLPKPSRNGRAPIGATVPDGPISRGFDYFHGIHHAGHMDTIIENDRVVERLEVMQNLPRLTEKAVAYIGERAGEKKPFFLYLPLGSPHSPIVPTPEWQGKSGLSAYADFVMQTDATVGAVTRALKTHGLAGNTLVIFTSDNGCSKVAKIPELRAKGHYVSAHLRGSKADIWDGGHRVPFVARWPGRIQPGTRSDQLICLVDLFATVGDILDAPTPKNGAEDSVSFLPALLGKPIVSTREGVIHHSISGHFAYRQGKWKLALARASGGWTAPRESQVPADAPRAQLYDLEADPGETKNLYTTHPEVAARLLKQLKADVERGRGTAGPEAANDIKDIVLWKGAGEAKSKKRKKK